MKKEIVLSATLLLFGCDYFKSSHSDTGEVQNQNLDIAISHCCAKSDSYMQFIADEVKKAATDAGIKKVAFRSANGNVNLQLQQAEQLLNQNPDVLLIALPSDKAIETAILKRAKEKNIPVVAYVKRYVSPINFKNFDNAYYVGSIPEQSGIFQGQKIIESWKNNPNWDKNKDGAIQYALLKGIQNNPDAEARTEWVQATIANYPNAGIKAEKVALTIADFDRNKAQAVVEDWHNNGTLDKAEVIIANNDMMALGALDVLQQLNIRLPIYGVDAMPEALRAVREGKMVSTIKQDALAQAKESLNLALNLGTKRDLSTNTKYKVINRELSIPYVAIDASNLDEFMQ